MRRAAGPGGHANIDRKHILCDHIFRGKTSREHVEYMTRIIFLGGSPNRRQDIVKLCRRGPGPSEHANIIQKHVLWHYFFR